MTTSKIAITLPEEQLGRVHREVRAGRADSVSGYIARVLSEHERRESLRELLRDLIAEHGEPRQEDKRWAKRSRPATAGITLDTDALITLDRGDKRMIALLDQAIAQRRNFHVPSGVVGQAWRDGRIQVNMARFLRANEVEVVPLDGQLSRSCGELCGATGTSEVIDASVVILARERHDVIVTGDPDDLRQLDPKSQIVRI
jgi:hypothetical protein